MTLLRLGTQLFRHGASISASISATSRRQVHHICASHSSMSALPNTIEHIERLANTRKNHANLSLIRHTLAELSNVHIADTERSRLQQVLNHELWLLPNETHPAVRDLPDDEPRCIHHIGSTPVEESGATVRADGTAAREFSELCRRLNCLRTEHLGHFTGPKSYYLLGALADLEQALIRFTVDTLRAHNFRLVSVPDILPASIIEGCGMQTTGDRNQVYKLDVASEPQSRLCLSGTAEMALAGHYAGRRLKRGGISAHRVMATSRCYRAETSGLQEERGIYRVHAFTKVEMFAVCTAAESDALLEEFRRIEEKLFERIRLPCRVLDMPPAELGAPAYRKYDIEAWLPGRKMYGEISSCSNCTDYQARRLDIRIGEEWAHTVNGTACAVPRMLIAILENNQVRDI